MSNYLSDIYVTDNHYYNYTLYRCYGILLRSTTYVRNPSFIICFSTRVIEFFFPTMLKGGDTPAERAVVAMVECEVRVLRMCS